jgi:hypothetical protein
LCFKQLNQTSVFGVSQFTLLQSRQLMGNKLAGGQVILMARCSEDESELVERVLIQFLTLVFFPSYGRPSCSKGPLDEMH